MSKESRFCRDQADQCRELARRADQLSRGLIELADECDARARYIESPVDDRPATSNLGTPPVASETPEPLIRSVKDAGRLLGLSRTTIYRLIGEGQLETVKIGNRTLIKMASIRSLVETEAA